MYLGLDLGTSGLKALLIDDEQAVIAEASAPLTVTRPHPGWSEQAPADWIKAASQVFDALAARQDLGAVRGIGLSGHMHGATLLDRSDTVLRPCILWNDTRASAQAAAMDANSRFRKITGNIVFPGFTAPKLAWVRDEEPDIFDRIARVLLPKDYLRLWLTGEHVSEPSDAAGTAWFDTGARDWSDDLLAATHMTRDQMPALVEGSAASGTLRLEIAETWGLKPGSIVAGGGGDNAASAIGVGAVAEGTGFVSLGTSGVLFIATDAYRPAPETAVHSFCHALPGRWHQMGVILSATDSLNWLAGLTGQDARALTRDLGSLQPPGRPLFLPYLGGERTPHNDANVRAALIGLSHDTAPQAATRAVLEGVAFALRDSYEALKTTGTKVDRLIAVGGGSQSDYWLAALATALDVTIDLPQSGDFGAAFGAARLGLMAATGAGAEVAPLPAIARSFAPDPAMGGAFDDAHARYRQTYAALKDLS